MNKPIGFFALLSIVISSQLGAGTFILPANIHLYGYYGLIGCGGAALLAILFAMIFAKLSITIIDNDKSGISLYINKTLGRNIGFFSGWVYWLICWTSSVELVLSANAFIQKFIGNAISPLILEVIILTFFSGINLLGVQFTSKIEKYLNIIKIAPLIILPVVLLIFYFNSDNIFIIEEVKDIPSSNMIFSSLLITFWGFIGLECATMTSREIKNKNKNVPRATIIGTFIMGILYIINVLGVVGSAPSDKFYQSITPFLVAVHNISTTHYWEILFNILSIIITLSALNVWILNAAELSYSSAKEKILPKIFLTNNKRGANIAGIFIPYIVQVIILVAINTLESAYHQIMLIVSVSTIAYLMIYLMCCLAMIIIYLKNKDKIHFIYVVISSIAIIVIMIILFINYNLLPVTLIFFISGLPYYIYKKFKSTDSDKF